jgi:hypothetical protein
MGADLISHFSMGESVFDAVELALLPETAADTRHPNGISKRAQ